MILGEYMENWPNHKNGLWEETIEITERIGLTLKTEELKARYYEDLLCLLKSRLLHIM